MEHEDTLEPSVGISFDRHAERRYWAWMALHTFSALPIFAIIAPATFALRTMGHSEAAAISFSLIALGLVLATGLLVAWLQTHHWLGWLFRAVRSRALIGAERLGRDDDELMLEGVREVVFEWHHIDALLRERETSATILAIATTMITATLIVVAPWIVHGLAFPETIGNTIPIWTISALIILALLYGASGLALAWSVYHSKCFSEGDYDPTAAIQHRVLTLLTEVKTLRRSGVIT